MLVFPCVRTIDRVDSGYWVLTVLVMLAIGRRSGGQRGKRLKFIIDS